MYTNKRLLISGVVVAGLAFLSGAPVRGTVPLAGSVVDGATPQPDRDPGPFVPGELIVKLKAGVGPDAAAGLQALMARHLGRRMDRAFPNLLAVDEVHRRYPIRARRAPAQAPGQERHLENVYRVMLGDGTANVLEAVRDLARDPDVEYAEPNYIVHATVDVNDPYFASSGSWSQPYADLWGIRKIQADVAWAQATGQGVIVAVSDTGLDFTHPDIQNRVRVNPAEDRNHNGIVDASDYDGRDSDHNGYVDDIRGWDFNGGDNDPTDDNLHGTHVSGTIAAQGNNGLGVVGVAHNARILPVKFLDSSGSGSIVNGAATIVYAAQSGADVINMSWGVPLSQTVADAVAQARALGTVLVAAAGNSNADLQNFSPAAVPGVIAVASTDQNDAKSDFSNWGQKLSVAAPGGGSNDPNDLQQSFLNILSLRAAGLGPASLVVGNNYLRLRGTSMASPHAAGTVALILSRQPAIGIDLAQAILEATATDIGAPGFDIYAGYGRINASAAVQAAGTASSLPELIVLLQPQKPFAAPGGPLPVRVLHLATHAVSIDGACGSKGTSAAWSLLHLSGLALAGANNRNATTAPDGEDGILTSEEIASLDLRGVEWVVLSGCETGTGAVLRGEGIFGLRRSFLIAGARTLVMSLWPVTDHDAREWIVDLYRARLAGRSTAEAIRIAHRAVLEARRAAKVSTHPFFWGAFLAAGNSK